MDQNTADVANAEAAADGTAQPAGAAGTDTEDVLEAMRDVFDPELGVNVVDLGLIYDLGWDDENDALIISMTLTSAGCPLTDVLEEQTAESLDGIVEAFRINWVWMPPWGPERITDDGRDMMRAIGFAI
jgi:metal-sulfur cluster biosynthetic enzyme